MTTRRPARLTGPGAPARGGQPGTFVVAIADPAARRRMAGALLARGLAPGQVIHPRAVVSPGAALGPGCVVLANAFVSTGAVLGAHVHVNYNATIGHDAVLGDFVTVLPGANVAGAVTLGAAVTVGSNACVLQGLRIGSGGHGGRGRGRHQGPARRRGRRRRARPALLRLPAALPRCRRDAEDPPGDGRPAARASVIARPSTRARTPGRSAGVSTA